MKSFTFHQAEPQVKTWKKVYDNKHYVNKIWKV